MRVAIVGTYPLEGIQTREKPISALGKWVRLHVSGCTLRQVHDFEGAVDDE